jgi:hypothetical protein
MNLVHRRVFPVALPVVSLGATSTPPPTIGSMRKKLKARLDRLRSYDLFLRDRTVTEWFKDNSLAVRWMRGGRGQAIHDESHQFWVHLSEVEKRQYIGKWIKLVESGVKLAGDARGGGIGLGYGPSEPTPPRRRRAIQDWLEEADAFIKTFEDTRQKMRIESRVAPSTASSILGNALKPVAWTIGLGAVGLIALVLLARPRIPLPGR